MYLQFEIENWPVRADLLRLRMHTWRKSCKYRLHGNRRADKDGEAIKEIEYKKQNYKLRGMRGTMGKLEVCTKILWSFSSQR